MPDPSQPDDRRTIGDTVSPFDTNEIRPIQAPEPPARVETPSAASDGYELDGYSVPDVEEPVRPVEIPTAPVERPKKPKVKSPSPLAADVPGIEESGSTEFVTELSEVDPVWSRMGEWGPDLVPVGISGFATLFLSGVSASA